MRASGGAEDATFGPPVARRRERADSAELASSRTPDQWQALQPVLSVVIDDDCTFAAFSSAQPPFFNFRVGRGPSYFVALAELVDTHCPLQRAPLPLSLRNFASSIHV
jgi:hypothetical protein